MNIEQILNTISTSFLNLSEQGFAYGSQGRMLLRNLEAHWFQRCVTMSPYNVFLTTTDKFRNTIQTLKEIDMDNVPYGLATIEDCKNTWNPSIMPPGWKGTYHRTAKVVTFTESSRAKDLFHKKQRERKVWWRKLAQNPSRFILSEAKRQKHRNIIDIEVQFPFGNITVESILYQQEVQKLFTEIQAGNCNAMNVQMIEHTTCLDWGCLALLCDSFQCKSSEMLIHPKISPYKLAFHITNEAGLSDSDLDELNRFILYLNNILRTKGLETILTFTEKVIEMYLVPFVVTVAKASLKNGIIHVTNRSTSLIEAVHFTNLANYIASRCFQII